MHDRQSFLPAEELPLPVLEIERLDVAYGATPVLHKVSLSVVKGQAVCLLGPNGAGKTTLIRTILGRVRPEGGSVSLADAGVGLVPQEIALFPKLTILENLAVFGRLTGLSRRQAKTAAAEVCHFAGLAERSRILVENLSGGWKRRVNLASAILRRPGLLILDEPTVGVDAAARKALHRLILDLRAQGMGLLLTTHDLEEAETLCSDLVLLSAGRVAEAGSIDQLLAKHFGTRLCLDITLKQPLPALSEPILHYFALSGDRRSLSSLVENEAAGMETVAILRGGGLEVTGMRLEAPDLAFLYRHLTEGTP
ncbi:MAG: ABC transporter ATP-binding protein [Pseudomonadota bacterium]